MNTGGSAIRVLVVGGSAAQVRTISDCLANTIDPGAHLKFKPNLAEAIDLLMTTSAHLLLIHAEQAERDPQATLAHVRNLFPSLAVVVFGDDDDQQKALQLISFGADDVLAASELNPRHLQRVLVKTLYRARTNHSPVSRIADLIVTNSLDGACAFDRDERIIFWNPAMERIFDIPASQVLGRQVVEVLPFFQSSGELALLEDCLKGNSPVGPERSYLRPGTKKKVYFRAVYSPVHGEDGQVVGAIGIVRNSGELRIAKRQWLESEEKFQNIAEASDDLVWFCKDDGERVYFNKRWLTFTGQKKEQAKHNGWASGIYPPHVQTFQKNFSKSLANREAFHIEYRLKRADGQYCWILDSGKPLFLPDGKFIGYLGLCSLMSETRVTQQIAAMDSVETPLTSGVLDNSPIGVWKLDQNLIITKANPVAAKSLGTEPENLVGKSFCDVLPSVTPTAFAAILVRGDRIHLPGKPITLKQGESERAAYWDVTAWPLRSENNEINGVCVSTMEVTERHKRTQQRDDFVATLVHDLKTPLIGADRTLESLINGRLGVIDSGQVEVLSMLKRSNHSLLIMIQNLIEVYKYEIEKPSLSFEPLDLQNVVASCVRELAAWADEKGLTLSESIPSSLPDVTGDRMAVRRLILNLMDNAIKFTGKGGSVSVSAEPAGHAIVINVTDTGAGIPEKERELLFKRYSRGTQGKNGPIGTGLGLYLCYQIVKAHRGTITCDSRENVGTTFSIVLPLKPDDGLGSTSGMFQVVSP